VEDGLAGRFDVVDAEGHGPAGAACTGRRHGSVAEAGGGAARHTRAWSVSAPAVVADCRRLRFRPSGALFELFPFHGPTLRHRRIP
jgi:hypothetical protein